MIYLLSLLIASFVSFAGADTGEPKNFCYSGCSERQSQIWEAFNQTAFNPLAREGVYSGECFHRSPSYNSSDPHHAVFLVSEVGGSLHMSGRLSFFSPENPYSDWTVKEALSELPSHTDGSHKLVILEKSALLDFSTSETAWRYWSRHTADGQTLLLIGQWGIAHDLFCELPRN